MIPSVPTLLASTVAPASLAEYPGDITQVAMSATTRSVRARVLGAGTVAALVITILVFTLTRGGPHERDPANVVAQAVVRAAPAAAADPPPAAVETLTAAPEPSATEPAPAPSAVASALSIAAAPVATAPARKATPAGSRPLHAGPAPAKSAGKDSVFDSRE